MRLIIKLVSFMTAIITLFSANQAFVIAADNANAEEWISLVGEHKLVKLRWGELYTVSPAAPDLRCRISVDEDTAEASIRMINTFDEDKSVVVYIAKYNTAGVLTEIKSATIIVPAKTVIPVEYRVRADNISNDNGSVKTFVWYNTQYMKPIGDLNGA